MPDNFTPEVLEVIETVATISAEKALKNDRIQREKVEREMRDARRYNMKKLIVNYRQLKKYAETAVYSSMQKEVAELINEIWDPYNRSEQIIVSIKTSATRTRIIMAHVDTALEQYRLYCESSSNPLSHDRFYALSARYIDEEEKSVNQIARKLHVDRRTVQRYIKRALSEVTGFMFGVDGVLIAQDEYENDE